MYNKYIKAKWKSLLKGWLRKCMTDLADSFFDVFVINKG